MTKGRMEAFSDGVIAIIITIMVLELRPPEGTALADLLPLAPIFLGYVLSFVFIGIYWNNHHHLLQAARHVDGRVLWANIHLLFWLSLVPFATAWMGEQHFAPWPVAAYGVVLLMDGVAYFILARALVAVEGKDSLLATVVSDDRKGLASLAIYAIATPIALLAPWLAFGLYVLVAIIWFVPDRRIEEMLARR